MKINFVILFFCLIFLPSCKNTESQVAQSNIEKYFENKFSEVFSDDFQILGFKHSSLYILEPLDTCKVVKRTAPTNNNKIEEYEYWMTAFDSFVGLSLSGCTRGSLNAIIRNDENYRKWQTGADEYVIISFVNVQDKNGTSSKELGLCFKLSKDLNILNVYPIEDDDEDYVYIKLFGQTSKRFYGAIDCEYNYLTRKYDFYVTKLQEDFEIECKYVFVKKLNNLLGGEYFELLDNMHDTVENCINKLDNYEDKKVLKNRAHEIIKSL